MLQYVVIFYEGKYLIRVLNIGPLASHTSVLIFTLYMLSAVHRPPYLSSLGSDVRDEQANSNSGL